MNKQIRTPEKELHKMEISNLSDAEFKTMIIRMLKELSGGPQQPKKDQSERKDTLTEINNNLQGDNSRVDEANNQINDLEHKEAKNNQSEPEEEKGIRKNEDSSDILIIGGPEGEEQEIINLFEKNNESKLP